MNHTEKTHRHSSRGERGQIAASWLVIFLLLGLIVYLISQILSITASSSDRESPVSPAPNVTAEEIDTTPTPAQEATPAPTSAPTPEPTPAPTPSPTPEPTPDPARFIKIATSKQIRITKQPGGETIVAGSNISFISYATGAVSKEWRFVSPNYKRELVWNDPEVKKEFPGVICTDGDQSVFYVNNVPQELDGWYVVCLYTDKNGEMLASDGAKIIIVTGSIWTWTAPDATPEPSVPPDVTEINDPGESPEPSEAPEPTDAPEPDPGPDPEPGTGGEGGGEG